MALIPIPRLNWRYRLYEIRICDYPQREVVLHLTKMGSANRFHTNFTASSASQGRIQPKFQLRLQCGQQLGQSKLR